MDASLPKLRGKLQVDTEFGTFLGDTRIRLLEAIVQHGSISQAAKAVPLSYKAAWDAIDAMNNLSEEPLVLRATGGGRTAAAPSSQSSATRLWRCIACWKPSIKLRWSV